MSILLFGANGQLGRELLRSLPRVGDVVSATRTGTLFDGRRCESADLSRPAELRSVLDRSRPRIVVNAAAYTAVDRAEQESATAFRVNAESPDVIARWCAARGIPFIHYSSDYVFDGGKTDPYCEDDPTAPLGVYGASKRDGEDAIRAARGRHMIFRTSWVHSAHGSNFLRTMLRLAANGADMKVVSDQVGSPTPAALVAEVTTRALHHPGEKSGTWHVACAGQTSWHGFAEAILAEAKSTGMLGKLPAVAPISSSSLPASARRPAWSVLDTSKLQRDFAERLPDWKTGMRQTLSALRQVPDSRS